MFETVLLFETIRSVTRHDCWCAERLAPVVDHLKQDLSGRCGEGDMESSARGGCGGEGVGVGCAMVIWTRLCV